MNITDERPLFSGISSVQPHNVQLWCYRGTKGTHGLVFSRRFLNDTCLSEDTVVCFFALRVLFVRRRCSSKKHRNHQGQSQASPGHSSGGAWVGGIKDISSFDRRPVNLTLLLDPQREGLLLFRFLVSSPKIQIFCLLKLDPLSDFFYVQELRVNLGKC